MATGARPPTIYRDVFHNLPGFARQGGDPEALFADLLEAEAKIDQLNQALEAAYEEVRELGRDVDRAEKRVRWLEGQLASSGEYLAAIATPEDDEVLSVDSSEEALIYAEVNLPLLVIGDTEEPAQEIDRHAKGAIWARKAWLAFQALQAYAQAKSEGFQGNFLSYCQDSSTTGHKISADWVAIGESPGVNNNPTYRNARIFSVPENVSAYGRAYMDQHIKLEKGSDPAPRIHFHDDTGGTTGKIYVGYLGRRLPSDQSN